MIHVLTVHFQTDRWIEIQLEYLARNVDRPYRVVADLEGVDGEWEGRVDTVTNLSAESGESLSHQEKLNRLAARVGEEAPPDDVLMFIDGDAFPIAPVGDFIEDRLARFPLAAVRRDESLGDLQPHPSFCVTTVGFWQEIGGDWSRGPDWTWENALGRQVEDVGGKLLWILRERGIDWCPLLRTNRHNLHPILFGVYEERVYHHGAGFRPVFERTDRQEVGLLPPLPSWLPPDPPPSRIGKAAWKVRAKLWYVRHKRGLVKRQERITRKNCRLSERVYAWIRVDPQFYSRL
jgi:hypothetical protein